MPAQRPRKLILPLAQSAEITRPAMPPVLKSRVSRSAAGEPEDLLEAVIVVASYDLTRASRSAEAPAAKTEDFGEALLALEAEDGTTVFVRADRLMDDLARLCPEAVTDEAIDLAVFRDRDGVSRGGPGTWLWKRLSVLRLEPDAVTAEALRQAQEWLGEELTDRIIERAGGDERAIYAAAWQGAKALMQAVEGRLAGEPGLYHWQGGALAPTDLCRKGDARFKDWGREPGLVFIHGTASTSQGSFGDLAGGEDWRALRQTFGERIFGFEHPTLSRSPIDNALTLAEVLPEGARLSLVTHSRGGLVGDLLCLGSFTAETRRLIDEYRRVPRPDEAEAEAADETGRLRALREQAAGEEQGKLTRLLELLERKALRIERYVRVACPASGTALISDNLEVFLSGLLELVRRLGVWGLGAAAAALGTPLAGQVAAAAADRVLKLLSRVVLEIADKRLQPQFVPGIEAMLPEAPMGAFLARAPRRQGVQMAVIAGDIEGGGILRRIGMLFTDWMFFDRAQNDLVVDTASMLRGLAVGNRAYALFDQGETVNHFGYFRNPRTRTALREWLVHADPLALQGWQELEHAGQETRAAVLAAEAASRGEAAPPANNTRPVVILLPGIMGSHLEVGRKDARSPGTGDRIWLDFLDLPRGGLGRIAFGIAGIEPEDLLDLAYGRLARHLEASHRVIRFPYDWRSGIAAAAERLADLVRATLAQHPDQPVRLLAHSMGGLVARAMIAADPERWRDLIRRPGGRLVMLGTPNHGSHLMVETLLGRSETIRTLARVDLTQPLNAVLAIVAAFPGALQLLPRPGFQDTGGPAARDYYQDATWQTLASTNHDFWFGRNLGGRPSAKDLGTATRFWEGLGNPQAEAERIGAVDRVAYVFGQADNTPCGIRIDRKGIAMLGTPYGDGSVTWASGRLDWLPDQRCWFMPVDHMGLTSTPRHFDDIVELLTTGTSSRLGRLPRARGLAEAPVRAYQPGPPPGFPSEADLVTRVVGGYSRREAPRPARKALAVGVRAMDLRFLHIPVLCGHYQGDPIAGAEARIDQLLVQGALTRRLNLGVHAGAVGATSVVLMPRSREDRARGSGRGAVVVGLGEMGELSSGEITESVRTGVLRLLLYADDRTLDDDGDRAADLDADTGAPDGPPRHELHLASLLIGYNSTTHISVDESVRAVTLGVLEANHQFARGVETRARRHRAHRPAARVARLEFVELFRDAAITAARAVRGLPTVLARELKRLDSRVDPDPELNQGPGVRQRLSLGPAFSYWPRVLVTDADRPESPCPAECYEVRTVNPIPPQAVEQLLALHGRTRQEAAAPSVPGPAQPEPVRRALRLKFVYLGQRARAEAVALHPCQPGLVEQLVEDMVRSTSYSPGSGIGHTLFHLLVPLNFKAAARETANLMLVVDAATANLPWEMLEADDEPLVLRTRLIRQLVSPRYRQQVRVTRERSVLLVVNPDTHGYHAEFGGPDWQPKTLPNGQVVADRLPTLAGAVAEAEAVRTLLERDGYQITEAPPDSAAGEVFNRVFARPYRILIVSAHGVDRVRGRDGTLRSGVVLSHGLLLTANEIGLMEAVPELVFLNCCHLGKMDREDATTAASHRLAHGLARELIEMGVRCIVAAGWEVDDAAGRTFAETFFARLVTQGTTFAQAIFDARVETHVQHPGINTWGAFQAYGDPNYRLDSDGEEAGGDDTLLAPDELLDWLERRRLEASRDGDREAISPEQRFRDLERAVDRRLGRLPAAWLDRPEVQQALGLLYGEFGALGFDKARAALLRAIAEEAKNGMVALASIEQLANLEVCQAERLSRTAEGRKTAPELARGAILRLQELIRITRLDPLSEDLAATGQPNPERQGLLGSALKRKAALMAATGESWETVRPVLESARNAYAAAEGRPDAVGFNPYPTINRLQLDAVLGPEPDTGGDKGPLVDLIERCQSAARRRFRSGLDFFDGLMPVDAALIPYLYPNDPDAPVKDLQDFARGYWDEIRRLAPTTRQLESVVTQLCLLAAFIRLRNAAEDEERAQALADLADQLDPGGAPCSAGVSTATGNVAKPPRSTRQRKGSGTNRERKPDE